MDLSFYKGKKVFITGHTGFKGSYMVRVLVKAGAIVTGYALNPPTSPSLFELCKLDKDITSIIGDIRDFDKLKDAFDKAQPEIVIHMAAQPLVRESYVNPRGTYETNVLGTANILECVRLSDCVKSFLNVTTDKVYENLEMNNAFKEEDRLGGYDPYSNSKACSELVTQSYLDSFLRDRKIAISTARAGNVIGGGDFAKDRIIPDCVRSVEKKEQIIVRNPYSTRPYQHVLEPVMAYLMICQRQYEDLSLAGNYNVGPDDIDCVTTGDLVTLFCDTYNNYVNQMNEKEKFKDYSEMTWINQHDGGPHEAGFLKLDCAKIKKTFGWQPKWHMKEVLENIVDWEMTRLTGGDILQKMDEQIDKYVNA